LSSYAKVLGIHENQLSVLGEGANGLVLTDGAGMAFKFPKHELAIESLKHEVKMINHISEYISVPVPNYSTTHLNRSIKEAYTAYPMIQGVSLSKGIYDLHREKLATQLLKLLDEIHAIPPLEMMKKNKMDFGELFKDIQRLIFPLITDEIKLDVEARFNEYLKDGDQISDNDCVIHGDLGAANVLCDAQTGIITGVIDWAQATIDNPAFDYSSLTCAVSVPQLKKDLLHLRSSLSHIFQQSSFIQYTFPFQEALHGIQTNDDEALQSGLKVISKLEEKI